VTPFALSAGAQFRPGAPPALDTAEYAAAFNEVKDLGRVDSPTRTAEQTQIARFWNDGLGTAFAMGYWNMTAQTAAADRGLGLVADARLFALLNIATADAQIACWDAKYAYGLWRPVTAVRAADADGNAGTEADATWTPLLVTPNFPSYASAHSTISAAAAGVLTTLFGDSYHFSVGSEGLPGVTRSFDSFAAAAAEAGRSRIYGGIHYQFDNTAAQAAGALVGGYVTANFLRARNDGADQLRAAAAAPAVVNGSIRATQVRPLLVEALARWRAAGVDTSGLRGIDVRVADLGGRTLGRAAEGHVIWLDDDAAGWGWFVDRTPRSDAEFTRPGDQGEQHRMDLLTVLEHEVGHLLGYGHEAGGVMRETLTAGTRSTPSPDVRGGLLSAPVGTRDRLGSW
jgi:membrane-associated phospholipid phosphatase